MSVSIFGITFYLYGLILGAAMVLALYLIEKKAEKFNLPSDCIWKLLLSALGAGLVGARLWHAATDFHLYSGDLAAIAAITQGGLSIFGGILGGVLGIFAASRILKTCRAHPPIFYTDLAIFGLPAAQGVGRLANWVNGELYGLPTALPWKIFVAPEHRLPGYENQGYYHPLFLYEMIPMLLFAAWIWWYDRRTNRPDRAVGSGFYTWIYVGFYTFLRFMLDFLRIDKTMVGGLNLGLNQAIIALVFLAVLIIGWRRSYLAEVKMRLIFAFGLLLMLAAYFYQPGGDANNLSTLNISGRELSVEVVSTPQDLSQGLSGRSEIGADGMLFIMPSEAVHTFWMKDMNFNIDIVWLRDGEVIDISYHVPKPEAGQSLGELPRFSPTEAADMVLELPAGRATELEIATGSAASLVK